MTLEQAFQLRIPGSANDLTQLDKVFAGRPPFVSIAQQGDLLLGELGVEITLIGEMRFPFQSRLNLLPERANLVALPIENPAEHWAELWGQGKVEDGLITLNVNLRLHAVLPEGEKWGGKAFQRMAELVFERTLSRILDTYKS